MQRRVLVLVQTSISSSKLGFEHRLVMYLLIINWFWIIFNQTKALKCLSLNIVKCQHVRFGEWQSAWHREFIQVSPSTCVTSYSHCCVSSQSLEVRKYIWRSSSFLSCICIIWSLWGPSTDSETDQNRKPQRHRDRPPETLSTETRRSSRRGKPGQTGEEETLLSYREATAGETERERKTERILMWKERRNWRA